MTSSLAEGWSLTLFCVLIENTGAAHYFTFLFPFAFLRRLHTSVSKGDTGALHSTVLLQHYPATAPLSTHDTASWHVVSILNTSHRKTISTRAVALRSWFQSVKPVQYCKYSSNVTDGQSISPSFPLQSVLHFFLEPCLKYFTTHRSNYFEVPWQI